MNYHYMRVSELSHRLDILYVLFIILIASGLVIHGTLQLAAVLAAITVLVAIKLGYVVLSLIYIMHYRVP